VVAGTADFWMNKADKLNRLFGEIIEQRENGDVSEGVDF